MFSATKPKVSSLLITAFLCFLVLSPVAQGVARVEPSKFLFTLQPGERITDAIKITNTQETEVEFTAVVYDWTLDSQDRLLTFAAGARADTLDGLIKFNPRRFKLGPGQSQYVRFTLTAPRTGDWLERRGIIFFEESRPALANAVGSTVVIQVGTTVYLSFSETLHSFHLYGVNFERTEEGLPTVVLDLANEGQAHIRYQVTYQITGEDGSLYHEAASEEQLILPASRRVLPLPLPIELPTGDYQVSLRLSFAGTTETLVTTVPFTMP